MYITYKKKLTLLTTLTTPHCLNPIMTSIRDWPLRRVTQGYTCHWHVQDSLSKY